MGFTRKGRCAATRAAATAIALIVSFAYVKDIGPGGYARSSSCVAIHIKVSLLVGGYGDGVVAG
ncbi:hypothetical protein KDA_21960 [Dictyobacter alpinus]|uniref:Uncharacterized protein n=1 Tax=Dictyobacter alpinus TaxID=2014873 RepID=A0A402B5T4_9CHLR|nr:hypothetical protein KDA_21960 [Dictyobacter alpinus]